jgi:hypothetical protein
VFDGLIPSEATGVRNSVPAHGEDEDPESGVAGTHVGSAETTPFRIVPEVGKVSENTSKCSQKNPSVPGVSHTSLALFQIAIGFG